MKVNLWIDNCAGITIHYSTYLVEPHFNFLIKVADVPEPFDAPEKLMQLPTEHGQVWILQ